MYRFLQNQTYVTRNPVAGVAMPRGSAPTLDPERSLTPRQFDLVIREAEDRPPSPSPMQMAWALRFLHATGLRLAEFTGACAQDLRRLEWEPPPDAAWPGRAHDAGVRTGNDVPDGGGEQGESAPMKSAWVVSVLGKGGKRRDVPVPSALVEEIERLIDQRRVAHDGAAGSGADAGASVGSGRAGPRHGSTPLVVSWQRDANGRWQGTGALSPQAPERKLVIEQWSLIP